MKNTFYPIRITVMLLVLLLSELHILAQNTFQGLTPDVPPSPQAVAFNRLGDYQLNNNYGAPDINIPLFEIDFHGYKIPLTLHYEASPLKPGYNYDVMGVGWTLSGNSCVSRTIKDRADEYKYLLNSRSFTLDSFLDWTLVEEKKYVDYANDLNLLNFQYDSYNIVLPSGRVIPFFMYMGNTCLTYNLLPSDAQIIIECNYNTNSLGSIDSFTVTDEGGVIYHFTAAEKTFNSYDNDPNANRNVTWLLTSIDIPSKGTITYDYTGLQTIYTSTLEEPSLRVSRLVTQMGEGSNLTLSSPPHPECPRYRMRFLKSISYGPTRVDFSYQSDSCHMREIVISDCGDTIRKYSLTINGPSYGSNLTSLVISGKDDEDRLVYGLTYTNSTPGNHTDYWGNRCYSNSYKDIGNFNMYFNNEEDGNIFLSQNFIRTNNLGQLIDNEEGDPYYYYKIKLQTATAGDSRQPTSPQHHGVLTSITYPNGGRTTFTWENHRFPTATAANGDFVFERRNQRIIEGGGFRIKSIVNYSTNDSIANEDHFRYGFTLGDIINRNFPLPLPDSLNLNNTINKHIGCGEAVVDPNLLTFMTFTYYTANVDPYTDRHEFQKMALGQVSKFRNMINIQGSATWWDAFFSANTFRALLGDRRPVVYPEITVYHGDPDIPAKCMGKTVYKYDIYAVHHDPHTYYLLHFNPTAASDTAYFERTSYDDMSDAPMLMCDGYEASKRHQLKSKSDYSYNTSNGTWDLISDEDYSYNTEMMSTSGYIFNSPLSRENRSGYENALGNNQWLADNYLSEFYKQFNHYYGRFTLKEKNTTTLRKGGTNTLNNMQTEDYSYLYPGVLSTRDYTDLYYRIRSDYSGGCDKHDVYTYVGETYSSDSVVAEMKSRNMLASVIYAETYASIPDLETVTGSKIDYGFFDNRILPSKLYEKNGDAFEESIKILSYDAYGNPTEIVDLKTGDEQTGIHTVFIWSSFGRYLSAMIKNATSSQIQGELTGTSQARYATLKALLPNAQIQTWDYKPLVGVSSYTDISGQTTLYEYDGLGRLKSEKRIVNGLSEPEGLREHEYNYINQQ